METATHFVVVVWPGSQILMEEKWFDECLLINTEEGLEEYGPSAYYAPGNRVTEDYIYGGNSLKENINRYIVEYLDKEEFDTRKVKEEEEALQEILAPLNN